jgi:dipeptidase E
VRLYLSSFRLGDHPERLVDLARGRRRAIVVANAIDGEGAAERAARVEAEIAALAGVGLAATELDLRDHFADPRPARLVAKLAGVGVVWLRGGNVFLLRYALARSGADAALRRLLAADALVYAGYSAGPCVLAPSLRGLEAVDDAGAVRAVHGAAPVWTGLGVLDYAIVPHVDSPDHPESAACGQLAARYQADGVPHRTLRDGEALVMDGDETEVLSRGR